MFKKSFVALAVAATASTAFAAQPGYFDGYVSGHAAQNSVSFVGNDENFATFGIRGSASYQDPSNIGGQLDVYYSQGKTGDITFGPPDLSVDFQDVALHVYHRNQEYLIGGILQRSTSSFGGLGISTNLYGVEGQYYIDRATLGLKVGSQKLDFGGIGPGSASGIFIDAEVRYFIEDNWRVNAGFASNSLDLDGPTARTTHWNIGTEYRLSNSPVSLFARYMNNSTKISGESLSLKNDTYMVGATLNFGGSKSLFERDRKGATLNPVNVDRVPPLFNPMDE
jgi:hypothetical protein